MSKLQIIIGSTRPTRAADKVAPWVIDRGVSHPAFDVEVLDLRDWPLPIFAEHLGTIGDFNDPTYSDPAVRRWNQKIKQADAYLVITPEYNHSVPGVLKNAIDNIFISFAFRNKPLVTVGYSGGIAGGVRAIEHLAQIAIEAELVPLRGRHHPPGRQRIRRGRATSQSGDRHQSRRRPRRPRLVVCRSGAGTGCRRTRARGLPHTSSGGRGQRDRRRSGMTAAGNHHRYDEQVIAGFRAEGGVVGGRCEPCDE